MPYWSMKETHLSSKSKTMAIDLVILEIKWAFLWVAGVKTQIFSSVFELLIQCVFRLFQPLGYLLQTCIEFSLDGDLVVTGIEVDCSLY